MADHDLGAWGNQRNTLEQAALTGRGSDADAPDSVRFGRAVAQLVALREAQNDAEFDQPAAFVFAPGEWQEQYLPKAAIRQPLLNTGHHTLTGRVHFVNKVANGHSLPYVGADAELFDTIKNANADTLPTLIYSPKKGFSTLSWYPAGIADEENTEIWHVADDIVTPEKITEAIDRAYKGELITPDQSATLPLWVDAKKGWAQENAEARVQHSLRMTLIGAFRLCTIRSEQPGKDGRTDIEIVADQGRPANKVVHHAVLELKVLREKGSTGGTYSEKDIKEHIRSGLQQAHTYGEHRNFLERMLCCFDMRADDVGEENVFAELKDDAAKLGVLLRHWYLYRSSDHRRDCEVGKTLAS
ncbi:hypothetical protein [Dyella sp. EPa41]|uniref:hypothetical protein n=1 Tax=Dyella sp. EPa41 TaxID=1561194 RepID=UPI001915179B|nr:hypothetical protein [Dyella sp. EPa41]